MSLLVSDLEETEYVVVVAVVAAVVVVVVAVGSTWLVDCCY